MTDLREGRIQAFLDDEMDAEARRAFIGQMARDDALAAAVRSQRARIARVQAALDAAQEALPQPTPGHTDHVLRTVLARVRAPQVRDATPGPVLRAHEGADDVQEARAQARGRGQPGAAGLVKAAGLLLFATGVAAATIPGSPVRTWLGELGEASVEGTATETAAPESPVSADDPERMGIRLPATATELQVVIAAPLSEPLRIAVVDEPMLEVMAGAGTAFATSEGRIEIHEPRGAVTVSIPRSAGNVSVRVGGSVFLRKNGDRVEVLHEGVDTLPSEFVFHPSGEGKPEG